MTTNSDWIRIARPLFHNEVADQIPTSPRQLFIGQIDVKLACRLNALWHSRLPRIEESNVVRNRRYICFAAEYKGKFYASAIWTDPVAANRMKNGDVLLELRRLAIADDAPRNTATRMIAVMVKAIRQRWPELVGLVSYQDTEVHRGTIYKAAGWKQDAINTNVEWTCGVRKRSTPQSTAPKVRWRLDFDSRRRI
jgi:hypothetical protein